MEDPNSFSAPVTTLNDDSRSAKAPHLSSKRLQHGSEGKPDSERSEETKYSKTDDKVEVDDDFKSSDLEANMTGSRSGSIQSQEQEKGHEVVDPNVVDWDGPDDPANPRNWLPWKVKTHIFLVSAITFIR